VVVVSVTVTVQVTWTPTIGFVGQPVIATLVERWTTKAPKLGGVGAIEGEVPRPPK
jgi:hypothetical protein